jgi:hypothetical protein
LPDPGRRFVPREEDVASKVIDGEAIIINVASGTYYSLDDAGALVWQAIQEGRPLGDAIAVVVDRYDVPRARAEADVQSLVAELLREGLVGEAEPGRPAAVEAAAGRRDKLSYEPPVLNVYRDMAELLALDPPVPGLGDTPWKEPEGSSR